MHDRYYPRFIQRAETPPHVRRIVPGDVLPPPRYFDSRLGRRDTDWFSVVSLGLLAFIAVMLVVLCLPR